MLPRGLVEVTAVIRAGQMPAAMAPEASLRDSPQPIGSAAP
jgi:hypothetical protein